MLNTDPVTVACETVTLAVPVLVRVTACVLLLPTGTSPKLMAVGLAVSSPPVCAAAVVAPKKTLTNMTKESGLTPRIGMVRSRNKGQPSLKIKSEDYY